MGDIGELNPYNAVKETIGLVKEIYYNEGINLFFNPQDGIENVKFRANLGRFQQIIMNLLSNAKDAVTNADEKSIEIGLWSQGTLLKLKVRDTGTGIPSHIKDRVFDPFFTSKEVNKGSGIGLYLVHNFIKELNGNISFESSESNGTCFTLSIPILESQNIQVIQPAQIQRLQPINILLVDDEDVQKEILRVMETKVTKRSA